MEKPRYIVHVDMDAFFAAIEQRDNPAISAKPVVIGADPKKGKGRGVVSTCSYEARKFGIKSAMPISEAYRRCPTAIFLRPDMEKYARASEKIYEIFNDFTPDIEPASIDEAFLDITGSWHLFKSPINTCKLIKSRIREKTGLTASVGLAPTKMVAKIASDLNKPDGLLEVTQEGLIDFLWGLPVDKILGLGQKTKLALADMGIRTIEDLAKRDLTELIEVFGKNGEYFWHLAWGRDAREVEAQEEAKSISNETTFAVDTLDQKRIETALLALCEKVSGRLRHEGLKGKTITLKIRLQGFHTYTRATTLTAATNFGDIIYREIKRLYNNFKIKGKVRLLGVKVSGLIPVDVRDSLFDEDGQREREKLHNALDAIKEKFGEDAIHRAGY